MTRFYICDVLGTGDPNVDDGFRPAIYDVARANSLNFDWAGDDMRVFGDTPGGKMIVWADVTDTQHAILNADARITWIPFEDAQGNPLGPLALIGDVTAARRTQIRTVLDNHHVPTADLSLSDALHKVIARVIRRVRIGRALRDLSSRLNLDFTEALATTIGQIPAQRRNNIRQRLQAAGYDVSVLLNSDTIAEAIRKLAIQQNASNINAWD